MNAMSANIEREMAIKMTSLGAPSTVGFYKHNKSDYQKHHIGMNEQDCVTCRKHITGIIPNDMRCRATCGTPLHKELKQRVMKVKNTSKLSKEEIREILAMSKLIQQTEQQRYFLHYE